MGQTLQKHTHHPPSYHRTHPPSVGGLPHHRTHPPPVSGLSHHRSHPPSVSGLSPHRTHPPSVSDLSHHRTHPPSVSGLSHHRLHPPSVRGLPIIEPPPHLPVVSFPSWTKGSDVIQCICPTLNTGSGTHRRVLVGYTNMTDSVILPLSGEKWIFHSCHTHSHYHPIFLKKFTY